ncbi:MAG: AI-2E family transporter [Neisseriaceae bacterium]
MQRNMKIQTIISTLLLVILIFSIMTLLGKVLVPFLIALILSYIVNPFVEKIQNKLKINRSILSFCVSILFFLFFISIPLFLLPEMLLQIKLILKSVPELLNLFNTNVLSQINNKYGTNFVLDYNNMRKILISNIATVYNNVNIFSPLAHNGMILLEIIIYIVLVPFIMFYSTANFGKLLSYFNSFIPKRYVNTIHSIIKDIDKLLAAYLRGQISVMIIMACYYAIGLNIVGLKSATIIGSITGLLVFIPYLGVLTGLVISLIVGFTDFVGMHVIIGTLIVFVIGHLLEGGLITPYMVGGKIGLNPIMIIFALMAFGKLFGLVGVLLALPLATIATVLFQHLKAYYLKSNYYSEET